MTTKTPDRSETRMARISSVATDLTHAANASAGAYVDGMLELARTLGGFGSEILSETNGHVRETVRARNLRSLAELQVAYTQRRIEMSATYAKEFADKARVRTEEVIAPLAAVLMDDKAA